MSFAGQVARQSGACACCRTALDTGAPSTLRSFHGWVVCADCLRRCTTRPTPDRDVEAFLRRVHRTSWDEHFLEHARLAASRSKDPSSQVGAVLVRDRRVLATGYNGFPRGVPDDYAIEKPEKYRRTVHAEANALIAAARAGVQTDGAVLYVSTLFPCATCAGLVIQAGVVRVVTDSQQDLERWAEQYRTAREMFASAGVEIVTTS